MDAKTPKPPRTNKTAATQVNDTPTPKPTRKPRRPRESKPLTLLANIERIIELAKDSKLSDEFLKSVKPHTSAVAERMEITETQALLLALLVNEFDSRVYLNYFSQFLGCEKIKIVNMMGEFDILEQRRLIRHSRNDNRDLFWLPGKVLDEIRRDRAFVAEPVNDLTPDRFFGIMNILFTEKGQREISFDALYLDLQGLIAANPQIPFTNALKRIELAPIDYVLLLYCFHKRINENESYVWLADLSSIFGDDYVGWSDLLRGLNRADNALIREKLIVPKIQNGIMDTDGFSLTRKAKEFLDGMDVLPAENGDHKSIIRHGTIPTKELYYNDLNRRQIDQLASLLAPDNYTSVRERLAASGMRTGFACLFHGGPGTGKTETAYQLARRTGRDIMPVDVSQTKSMWFGESEKLIKEVFDRYRTMVRKAPATPILLFNEADAVIGKRGDVSHGGVSQTENAIQNIILQEMETLDGIMIATTNLTRNLDDAFERRFLYKIEFAQPTVDAKSAIWRTMLPGLDPESVSELARGFDLSGGQIENVARKCAVESIIHGAQPPLSQLREFCRSESLNGKRPRIGF